MLWYDPTIDRSATSSPDGKLLATSGANTPICVWEVQTGKLVRTHPNRGSVYDLRWRANGKLAAVTFFNHDVFLMQEFDGDREPNVEEQKRITVATPVQIMKAHRANNHLMALGKNQVWCFQAGDHDRIAEHANFFGGVHNSSPDR